jgi:FtsZ-binding cell division protein ZapB
MTEWVKREHSEGRHILYIEWDAIEQLQREVDALKARNEPALAAEPTRDELRAENAELRARCERLRNLLAAGQTVVRSWPVLKDEQPIDVYRFRWLNEVNGALAALDAAEGKGR